jgi:periplasmic protein TonB
MPDITTKDAVAEQVGHLSVHIPDQHPRDVPFLFEQQQKRIAPSVGFSFASHVVVILLVLFVAKWSPLDTTATTQEQQRTLKDIIWLNEPGPGGGGGGGGNRMPDPPKKAELPGKAKLSVPVAKLPEVQPLQKEQPKDEPKPEQQLQIPAKTLGASTLTVPGTLDGTSASTLSLGSGSGGGAGTGTGTGIGPGNGSGLGPGWGGGTGGGAYRPGAGIENPIVLREVKPQYTADAMRAKIQGIVIVECVVMPDGTVAEAQVVKSLDPTFGLDQEAIKAAKMWRFVPGKKQGQPVPVLITIELTFNLR